jgi:hypothetical protein
MLVWSLSTYRNFARFPFFGVSFCSRSDDDTSFKQNFSRCRTLVPGFSLLFSTRVFLRLLWIRAINACMDKRRAGLPHTLHSVGFIIPRCLWQSLLSYFIYVAWVWVMLRPTVSRPVCLGIKHPSGAYDQIFITCVTVTVLFLWDALSKERAFPFVQI